MVPIIAVLHNIRSAYNVGAILRTADGAGVGKVYLTGITPTPIDRFGRKRADIAKAALGAEEIVAWEHHDDIQTLLLELKQKNNNVIAVEQDERSVTYELVPLNQPTVFIFGAEVEGLPPHVLDVCDAIVELPMRGNKESLNVSVAAGIVLYHARRGDDA